MFRNNSKNPQAPINKNMYLILRIRNFKRSKSILKQVDLEARNIFELLNHLKGQARVIWRQVWYFWINHNISTWHIYFATP